MAPKKVDYKAKIDALNADITKAADEAAEIMTEFEGKAMPEAKADAVDKLCVEAEEMQIEVKRFEKLAGIEKHTSKLDLRVPHKEGTEPKNPAEGEETQTKADPVVGYITVGRMYTLEKEYREGASRGFQGSSPMTKMQAKDGLVPITESMLAEIKADDVTTSIAGDLIQNDRVGEIIKAEDRPLRVRGLLTVGGTGSDTIEYLEETFDNQAAGVPEIFTGENTKPKSDIRYEEKTSVVKQIAHYIRVSNKMMEDAPQLQLAIDSRLSYGLDKEEEDQLLWGTGASNDLTGILNTAGIQDYATAIHAVRGVDATDTLLDKIRRSRTNVEMEFLEASGVVLHPIDFEEIELLKGSDSRYLWVTVPDGGGTRVWRLPVVETVSMAAPSGTGERHCLVGAFKMGAAIFDRTGTNIEIGYANDDFITNYKRVRAEKRLALVVWRPAAFIDIETEAASS
jgi:HK97 family phage major capsid protein